MDFPTGVNPDASDEKSQLSLEMSQQQTDDPFALSSSLGRLSINPAQPRPSSSPATAPVSPTQIRKPPIQRSNTHEHQSRPSSRRTSASFGPRSNPTSPNLRRKSPRLSQSGDGFAKHATHRHSSSPHVSRRSSMAYGSSTTSSVPENETSGATSSSIAANHFRKELEQHKNSQHNSPDTIVIIHDSCYGHRFSRPRTSKANLSLIVERPERIKAGVLGLSSAYVRLGERHASGQHGPHPHKSPPPNLPFLIHKSTRSTPITSTAVTNIHGTKWMHDLHLMCNSAQSKLATGSKELGRPETPGAASKPKLHQGDLYLCQESLDAFQGALGGVLDAVDAVFAYDYSSPNPTNRHTKAFVCVRPPGHHCSADMPSGFCWLNNVHVGIEHAALSHGLTHAAIIDFDLHHGDGSQTITWERNAKAARMPKNTPLSKKTAVGYFSLHDINSYPCEWGDQEKVQSASLCIENAHNQSIWNVHLQPWKTLAEFWELYETRYTVLLDKARAFLHAQTKRIQASSSTVKPKAAIFISAGFDASEWEGEGMQRHKVNVPTEFYARFTADILKLANEQGNAVEGRVISVLEGGYSDRALISGIMSHLVGLAGSDNSSTNEPQLNGGTRATTFNPEWWTASALSELDAAMSPPEAIPASRKFRSSELSTFAEPTQSFTAKVVDPSKVYRSLSGVVPPPKEVPFPPTASPPEVDWATAAFELSKLLIPTDRTVDSYKHEELSEPRVKSDRHSSVVVPSVEQLPQPQTRGRKAKTPTHKAASPAPSAKAPVRPPSNRRRTLSDLPSLPDESPLQPTSGLNQFPDHPTPADFKARSEEGDPQISLPSNISVSSIGPDSASGEIRLGKTRRQSAALADIQRLGEQQASTTDRTAAPADELTATLTESGLPENAHVMAASLSQPAESQAKDIEKLTSGVKKITLRMNSKEAPQPKAVPTKKPAAKAPRKSTAPRSSKPNNAANKPNSARAAQAPKVSSANANSSAERIHTPAGQETIHMYRAPSETFDAVVEESNPWADAGTPSKDQIDSLPNETLVQEPNKVAAQPDLFVDGLVSKNSEALSIASSNVHTTGGSDATTNEVRSGHDVRLNSGNQFMEFIPYQPSSQPTFSDNIKPDSITWLPPNTNTPVGTPMAKRGKENLPIFTSDGHIPFAPPTPVQSNNIQTNSYSGDFGQSHLPYVANAAKSQMGTDSAYDGTNKTKVDDDSIWEVTDSSAHPK